MPKTNRVLLIGAGAVGVYFSSRLAQAGAEVSVVARSNFDYVKKHGYGIKSYLGDYLFTPAGVYPSAEDCPGTPDWIVIATKVLPDINLPELIRGAVRSKDTRILLIQNGIDVERSLEAAFPENPLYHAVAYIGTHRSAPGVICHEGAGNLTFGRNDGVIDEEGKALSEAFASVKVDAKLVDNIRFYRWKKLLWNTPYNSVSVLGGSLNTREMSDRGAVEALCRSIMDEVAEIAAADGTVITEEMILDNIEFTRNFPPYKTSMLVDYEAGRPLEIDAFVGNVLKIADRYKINAPHIQMIDTLLRALTRGK